MWINPLVLTFRNITCLMASRYLVCAICTHADRQRDVVCGKLLVTIALTLAATNVDFLPTNQAYDTMRSHLQNTCAYTNAYKHGNNAHHMVYACGRKINEKRLKQKQKQHHAHTHTRKSSSKTTAPPVRPPSLYFIRISLVECAFMCIHIV